MFDWSLNMKRSLCTGGRASVGRLLAEAEDYSRIENNVNAYFLNALIVYAGTSRLVEVESGQ
jgi:hypothetical protein